MIQALASRTSSSVSQYVSCDVQVLPDDQGLNGSQFQPLERIINAKAVFARIPTDFVKVALDQSLLLNELDVCE